MTSASITEGERDEVLFNELTKILDRIIEKLPPQRRIIFRLNRFYNMTYKAIADKLRITENTVDTQIRRALAYIREEYIKYIK
jgi:RNA polymerase sigma-70 factor (ECF subfamily)